ncbi:MAG TPA: entericidin [Betaproteobacteria bacterium]|nr:entericidin [Betaproteobacteria bacterium]
MKSLSIVIKAIQVVLLAAGVVTLVGCNTMHGLGKDLKKGGAAIERAAK